MRKTIELAHKHVAEVAGEMSLALVRKKLSRSAVGDWSARLREASIMLHDLAEKVK